MIFLIGIGYIHILLIRIGIIIIGNCIDSGSRYVRSVSTRWGVNI